MLTQPLKSSESEYAAHIEEIDRHHEGLGCLIRDLQAATAAGGGKDALSGILGNLLAYMKVHFATEERVMRAFQYPGRDEHTAQHDHFKRNVGKYSRDFMDGRLRPEELVSFLEGWFLLHSKTCDPRFLGWAEQAQARNSAAETTAVSGKTI